jgi:hypothetical protein
MASPPIGNIRQNRLLQNLQLEKVTTAYEPVEITFNGEFIDSTQSQDANNYSDLFTQSSIIINKTNPNEEIIKKKRKRQQPGDKEGAPEVFTQVRTANEIVIGTKTYRMPDNLPPNHTQDYKYIMNDREKFLRFIDTFMKDNYGERLEADQSMTCETLRNRGGEDFSLLTHQEIVKDYMNLYTPYRGLLLYHGLGSGKTCTSIAIAEGMKSSKRIIIMVPASLRKSYISELKKCGDIMYRKERHWVWISVKGNDELVIGLSNLLGIKPEYISKQKGAFVIDVSQQSNYGTKDDREKKLLNDQIDLMIETKYTFISYNGLNSERYGRIKRPSGQQNLFDNSVVIIDEAHNLVSRIINKLGTKGEYDESGQIVTPDERKVSSELGDSLRRHFETETEERRPDALKKIITKFSKQYRFMILSQAEIAVISGSESSEITDEIRQIIQRLKSKPSTIPKKQLFLSEKIYGDLMRASDARIVMLTGTPIINKSSEMGVLFNILRGYIVTYKIEIRKVGVDKNDIEEKIKKNLPYVDFVDFNERTLTFTRNPTGFSSEHKKNYPGVSNQIQNSVSHENFLKEIKKYLVSPKGYKLEESDLGKEEIIYNKALPDSLEVFNDLYIDENGGLKDRMNLERRIIGLTSYFRSAQENLLPRLVRKQIVLVNMSKFQFSKYTEKIQAEKKDNVSSDTYKMFTRLICNYAVDGRPYPVPLDKKRKAGEPTEDEANEALIKAIFDRSQRRGDVDDRSEDSAELDELMENVGGEIYKAEMVAKVQEMSENLERFFSLQSLEIHSPKFRAVVDNILSEENIGLNLVYSQFRSFEGLTLFSLALKANGFCELKLVQDKSNWVLDEETMSLENIRKPKYGLYGDDGNEDKRDILRNIYNGVWGNFNVILLQQLQKLFQAREEEGLSSVEPNNNFGEIMKVFMITSSGSEGINLFNTRYVHIMEPYWHPVRVQQVIGRARRICSHQNLQEQYRTVEVFVYVVRFTEEQKTTLSANEQQTTDEYLNQLCLIKETVSNNLTKAMKESAFDCSLYPHDPSEGIRCLQFAPGTNSYSYNPSYNEGINEEIERGVKKVRLVKGKVDGVEHLIDQDTNEKGTYNVYDEEALGRQEKKVLFTVRMKNKSYERV